MDDTATILGALIQTLPSVRDQHRTTTNLFQLLKLVARKEAEALFSGSTVNPMEFDPFGELTFPYHKMGAIDSLNLFDLNELIIFSFYEANRGRYRRALDIGANIGLHSIILRKCGFEVRSYEPDPDHFDILKRNLELNQCVDVEANKAAVSDKVGSLEFIRVLGNTTASHLTGSRDPYGELESFPVEVESIRPLIEWADLIKMDVEGHEPTILLATSRSDWQNTDALVEIQNEENAGSVFDHFNALGVNLFSQKINWNQVTSVEDMPTSYRDGTLFITSKTNMPWG